MNYVLTPDYFNAAALAHATGQSDRLALDLGTDGGYSPEPTPWFLAPDPRVPEPPLPVRPVLPERARKALAQSL